MQCKKVGMMIGRDCKTNLGKKVRLEYWSLQKKFNGRLLDIGFGYFFHGADNVWYWSALVGPVINLIITILPIQLPRLLQARPDRIWFRKVEKLTKQLVWIKTAISTHFFYAELLSKRLYNRCYLCPIIVSYGESSNQPNYQDSAIIVENKVWLESAITQSKFFKLKWILDIIGKSLFSQVIGNWKVKVI